MTNHVDPVVGAIAKLGPHQAAKLVGTATSHALRRRGVEPRSTGHDDDRRRAGDPSALGDELADATAPITRADAQARPAA